MAKSKKSKKKVFIIVAIVLVVIIAAVVLAVILNNNNKVEDKSEKKVEKKEPKLEVDDNLVYYVAKLKYKDGNVVKVGSGFSDELRKEVWQNQDKYLGAICEVKYFEETSNADGGLSLRFPIFKDFRSDKTEADF
jgi:hypothetical protein